MEIPYEVKPRRDTGLYNAKLGVWLFLASEVMLFGGLFSAYVFLRTGIQDGVDNPWPWGLNVHKGFVWLGFLNTLVLIASSVGVVFAWVALKERNWRKYQIYMYFVVACAVVFMCVKTVEYNSKLNKHHGIKLVDNSVMEGTILEKTDRIRFEGNRAVFGLQGALPAFLKDISDEDFPAFTATVQFKDDEDPQVTEISSESQFKKWFHQNRRTASKKLTAERRRYRAEMEEFGKAAPVSLNTSATVVASEPFQVNAKPTKVVGHSDSSVNYRDGSKVEGKLISDDVKFVMHEVDLQLVLPQKQRDSIIWDVINDESAKQQFFAKQQKHYEEMRDYYEARGETIPEKMLRGHMLNLQTIDHEDHGDHEEHHGEAPHKSEAKHSAGGGHGDHSYITVPRDKIKFMGNHGPRYGNYYALYFTMTALHGLHVVGGALVLLFFTVFGKKLYLKNPEHLANRVEVGGLFWHFVDLIWIFLFPLMYLL
ncbi:MAG: cytochrome c oxidase subunit 3 [Verrucomicrobiales bacterium]|nr:cytochrome c oxidase subunit 3 [Verrucomicrobiales bacterium]